MLLYAAARRPANEHLETDLDRAIRYAAALYDRLTAAGHTPDSRAEVRTPKTRKTPDHLATLSPDQTAAFERFYRAYGVLKGKQRAAARWAEINPDADLARCITDAAAADAAAPRPADAVRKYPEGWLSERRWEDVQPPRAVDGAAHQRAARVRELEVERAGLARLVALRPSADLDAQLARLAADLAALGGNVGPASSRLEAGSTPRPNGRPTPLADLVRGLVPGADAG
jgi:hypothetical protein